MGLLSTIGAASGRAFGFTRSAIAVATDAFFNRVTLLLPGNGTNGAQNNTFLDSSSNNFTITRNGNTTQGTFSPFSQTGWSNYFDGTGDYLTVADNAAFDLGSGDFLIEAWAYSTDSTNFKMIIGQWNSGGNLSYTLRQNANKWAFAYTTNGSTEVALNGTSTQQLNAWAHLAVIRTGTTLSLFVNGTREATASVSGVTIFNNTGNFSVGGNGNGNDLWVGYIASARIIKTTLPSGYDATSSSITVPTASFTSTATTSILTCQSNRFIDNSTNAFTITRNGDVSVQAFSPFAPTAAYSSSTVGGSGYFDGSGDYLNTAANAAFDFGTGAFTVEAWFYPTDTVSDGIVATSNNTAWGCVWIWTFGTEVRLRATSSTSGADLAIGGGAFQVNAWNHVAAVRSGNDFSLYLNGTRVATGTSTTALKTGCNAAIGCMYDNSYNSFYSGYIASVRMVKGGALYSGTTYTIPTAPFTTSVSAGTVSLLTNFTNAGITDATAKNVLETVGNAQISTTQSKFGGSSMLFDGNDALVIPYKELLNLKTTFTIEAWIYPTNVTAGYRGIYTITAASGSNFGTIALYHDGTTLGFELRPTSGGGITVVSGGTLSANTWQHVAISVSSLSGKLFLNGTQVGSTTTFTDYSFTVVGVAVGNVGNNPTSTQGFVGYIDDLRITRGNARYTANFTAPSSAFELQ